MPCYKPLRGYKASDGGITFNPKHSPTKEYLDVPCGQCIGCRLEKSREWAVRMVHELKNWDKACFITLTYDDEHLPLNKSLSVTEYAPYTDLETKEVKEKQYDSHFQTFMKDLRYHFSEVRVNPETGRKKRYYRPIRFFQSGEYGQECKNCGQNKINCYHTCGQWSPTFGRPHYHAILFNVEFNDLIPLKKNKSGEMIYKSETLSSIWKRGYTSVGNVTFESCAYVARYVTKKITGEQAEDHYVRLGKVSTETGEIETVKINPEYANMSRRPGIGKGYIERYFSDVYPNDRVVLLRRGESKVSKPPRYYDKLLQEIDPHMYEDIKQQRRNEALKHENDSTDERLMVREAVRKAQTKTLHRNFDYES